MQLLLSQSRFSDYPAWTPAICFFLAIPPGDFDSHLISKVHFSGDLQISNSVSLA
jgi:hypothetical protein